MIKPDDRLGKFNPLWVTLPTKKKSTRNGFESDDSLTFNPGNKNRYIKKSRVLRIQFLE